MTPILDLGDLVVWHSPGNFGHVPIGLAFDFAPSIREGVTIIDANGNPLEHKFVVELDLDDTERLRDELSVYLARNGRSS
jgi:hypothetical protein